MVWPEPFGKRDSPSSLDITVVLQDISSVDYHLPEMRLAQRVALEDANTYFITAMDLGTLYVY